MPFPGIASNAVNDDSSNTEEDVEEEKYSTQDEDDTTIVTDHIDIFLDPDVGDEKIITLCGSIDEDDNMVGQVYLSYKSSIRIDLFTKSRLFGQVYDKRRGFKFNYRFIAEQESKYGELMSITSTTSVKAESVGHITSLNFPYPPPKGIRHKTYLRSEVGTNFELRVTKSMVHLLKNGTCDMTHGELTSLTLKDYFGDISLYPPIPNIWSICLRNHTNNRYSEPTRAQILIRGQYHEANRIKSIQSNFHVLSIESTSFSQTPFLLFYKSSLGTFHFLSSTKDNFSTMSNSKILMPFIFFLILLLADENFTNKAAVLPSRYLQESCDGSPCSKHGTCTTKMYKNSSLHYCKCNHHWTGLFCHMTLCERNPCGDRGVCKLDTTGLNTFNCHCNPGYTGKTCRDILEKCERNNPCRDRGRCSMINGEPNCSCQPWFEGE